MFKDKEREDERDRELARRKEGQGGNGYAK